MKHSLVVRLDSFGDVLICGPAVRAVAGGSDRLTMLVGPRGAEAAWLLPGVDEVLAWNCPWIASPAPEVTLRDVDDLVQRVREAAPTHAVILTSFHQSALPTALLLRLAGVGQIAAVSEDYPGTLLDSRISPPPEAPEPQRMSAIAAAAGFPLPAADDGRLAVRRPLPRGRSRGGPVRRRPPGCGGPVAHLPSVVVGGGGRALTAAGRSVVVTGGPGESAMTAAIAAAAPDAPRARLGRPVGPGRTGRGAGACRGRRRWEHRPGASGGSRWHTDRLAVCAGGPGRPMGAVRRAVRAAGRSGCRLSRYPGNRVPAARASLPHLGRRCGDRRCGGTALAALSMSEGVR